MLMRLGAAFGEIQITLRLVPRFKDLLVLQIHSSFIVNMAWQPDASLLVGFTITSALNGSRMRESMLNHHLSWV